MVEAINNNELGADDLFSILLTQLNYQDPLKPVDNKEFVAQLAQFTALEQAKSTNEQITNLLKTMNSSLGVGLLNKTVQAQLESATVVGEVTAIRFDNGVPVFTVKDAEGEFFNDVTLGSIQIVR